MFSVGNGILAINQDIVTCFAVYVQRCIVTCFSFASAKNILKFAKNPNDLDIDGFAMDDKDDATQFKVWLGAESPLSANLTKLPNLSLPQLQSVNLARFDLNIRCPGRPPLHKFHHKCKFGLYLM